MTDTVIEVENASKLFKLYHNPITGPVKEILFPWRRNRYYESFWAVKDVNMQFKRGEVLGIVGHNGAGKTTLLKMIAGLVAIMGRVVSLLVVGTGYHPELSGRENSLWEGSGPGLSAGCRAHSPCIPFLKGLTSLR